MFTAASGYGKANVEGHMGDTTTRRKTAGVAENACLGDEEEEA